MRGAATGFVRKQSVSPTASKIARMPTTTLLIAVSVYGFTASLTALSCLVQNRCNSIYIDLDLSHKAK
jgi:hypothetical protein